MAFGVGYVLAGDRLPVWTATGAAVTCLAGIAPGTFGYAGAPLTSVAEIVIPLAPIAVLIVLGRSDLNVRNVIASIGETRWLWAMVGWAFVVVLWAVRPGIALTTAAVWLVVVATLTVNRVEIRVAATSISAGLTSFCLMSNLRSLMEPVTSPFEVQGPSLLPIDNIIGFAEDSTELADMALLAFLASVAYGPRSWRLAAGAIALTTIILVDQRCVLVAFPLTIVWLLLRSRNGSLRKALTGIGLLVLAALVPLAAVGAINLDFLAKEPGENVLTLSGRTQTWAAVLQPETHEPQWLPWGSGPGAEELFSPPSTRSPFVLNVNNRPLQLAVTLGLPGLILAVGALARGWRRQLWNRRSEALLVAVLLSGMTVPHVGGVGLTPATLALAALVTCRHTPHRSSDDPSENVADLAQPSELSGVHQDVC